MAISREVKNTESKRAGCFSLSRLFLPLALLFCLCVLPAHAQSGLKEAQALNSIGLFAGSDKGFELERTPTRAEALVMLLKLTGQAQQAQTENLPHPFTDGGWASAFIGYGYTHKYTSGVSDTEFGTAQPATAQQYSVFLLRALGYTINEDYTYEKALSFFLSHAPALTPAVEDFTRGDMAAMSLSALAAPMKDGSGTLAQKLSGQDLFSMEDYKKAREGAVSEEKADVTVLMYVVGSDLESNDGRTTANLHEMLEADLNDSINLVLQTGGTADWKNDWMTDGATQRFQITDDEIVHLSTLENALMSTPDTLSNFLRWGVTAYPADRYIAVFIDHGEGTMNGFGIDEMNGRKTLSLGEMSRALDWSDTCVELTIFDACLMSTLTNAYILRDHSDYLLASEAIMPADGLFYTNWLNMLAQTPALSVDELSQAVIEDYIEHSDKQLRKRITFSLITLENMEQVMTEWRDVLSQLSGQMKKGSYALLSETLEHTASFDFIGIYDQFDLIDCLEQLEQRGLAQTGELRQITQKAVLQIGKLDIEIANGLAVYIPYNDPEQYLNITRASLLECGLSETDLSFFDLFSANRIFDQT